MASLWVDWIGLSCKNSAYTLEHIVVITSRNIMRLPHYMASLQYLLLSLQKFHDLDKLRGMPAA